MFDLIAQAASISPAALAQVASAFLPIPSAADLLKLSGLLLCAAIVETLARKAPERREA